VSAPYRNVPVPPTERRRTLDPWRLALLFAWVCDVGRIGVGLVNRRPVDGELGFAAFLTVVTLGVALSAIKSRRPAQVHARR
jgi:hypothetical protein